MNKDLTVGKPSQVLWQFCLPMFGSIIFQQLYNIADSLVAGKFIGENALAAVGNSYEITLIFIAFAFGCNIGCSVIVSRYFGAKEYREMKTSVYTSLIGSAVLCAVLMGIGLFGCDALLELINTPEEILADSALYLDIYVLGLPFMFFYNIATGIFSALGDSKTPLYFLILASFLNIGLDLLFIIVFKWGVFGAAFATVLSQGVSGILCVIYALKKYSILHLSREDFKPDFSMMGKHLAIGLPMAFQFSITAIGTIVLQSALNTFGSDKIAAYTAGCKVEQLVTQIGPAIGVTMANYAGQNLGAGRLDRIKKGVASCTIMTVSLAVVSAIALYFGAEWLSGLFISGDQPGVVASAVEYVNTICVFFPILYMIFVYRNVLQGVGRSLMPLMAGVFELIARCVVSFTLPQRMGYVGVCLAGPVAWIAAMVPLCIAYYIIMGKLLKKSRPAQA